MRNLNNFLNANETHHLSHTKSSIYFHVDCILNHFQVVCMVARIREKTRNYKEKILVKYPYCHFCMRIFPLSFHFTRLLVRSITTSPIYLCINNDRFFIAYSLIIAISGQNVCEYCIAKQT